MEVNNTPWGEQHCYLLSKTPSPLDGYHCCTITKKFHISPFMQMDMTYNIKIAFSEEDLNISIKNTKDKSCVFYAGLTLSKKEINKRNMLSVLVQYPFMTAKTIVAIYYQALKLWLKRVQFVPHPKTKNK